MPRLSDYMLVSDVDGTLVDPVHGLSPRNVAAINRFIAGGGRFGIATGRARFLMEEAVRGFMVNAPCILYNGCMLYDGETDTVLWEQFLPDGARAFVEDMMARAPYTAVVLVAAEHYYLIRSRETLRGYFEAADNHNYGRASIDEVPLPWYKALFRVAEADYERLVELSAGIQYPGVRFVPTYSTLVEMLPAGCNKGRALEELVNRGYVKRENLVAVGDFYNDLEMLRYAGIGAAPSDAPADIRAQADLVVGNCRDGAVADVIEHLEAICRG